MDSKDFKMQKFPIKGLTEKGYDPVVAFPIQPAAEVVKSMMSHIEEVKKTGKWKWNALSHQN